MWTLSKLFTLQILDVTHVNVSHVKTSLSPLHPCISWSLMSIFALHATFHTQSCIVCTDNSVYFEITDCCLSWIICSCAQISFVLRHYILALLQFRWLKHEHSISRPLCLQFFSKRQDLVYFVFIGISLHFSSSREQVVGKRDLILRAKRENTCGRRSRGHNHSSIFKHPCQ